MFRPRYVTPLNPVLAKRSFVFCVQLVHLFGQWEKEEIFIPCLDGPSIPPLQECNAIPRQVCKEVPEVGRVEKVCQPTETEECRDVPREVCRPERECAVVERSRPSRECSIVPEEVCEELERQVVKEVCVPTPRQECRYANIYRARLKGGPQVA